MAKTVSLREFGRRYGVSGEAVRKAIASGRLLRAVFYDEKGRPSVDPAIATQEWAELTSPSIGGKRTPVFRHVEPEQPPPVQEIVVPPEPPKPRGRPPKPRPPKPEKPAPEQPAIEQPAAEPPAPQDDIPRQTPGGAAATFAQSRAIKEAYLARLAKLEFEEKSGVLVKADAVKNEAFKVARLVRDAMLNIPDRVSSELAADSDQFVIHRKLTLEIRRALEGLGGDNA